MAEKIDPEKVSNVQKTSNKRDQTRKERLKTYADVTIYAVASYAKLGWC